MKALVQNRGIAVVIYQKESDVIIIYVESRQSLYSNRKHRRIGDYIEELVTT